MSSRSARSGLPSGPGQRSRSVARSRDDDRDRDRDRNRSRYDDDRDTPRPSRSRYDDDDRDAPRPSARQIRPQKSMGSIKQGRSGSQPPPPMPSSRSRQNARPSYEYDTRSESGNNRSSDSTTSSGSSSFFDRMRGYTSSRTSFEDEEPEKPAPRSLRSRRAARDESPPSPEEEEEIAPGEGHSLWSQIASAANSLTVNVSKAWTSNVTTFAGEETPVGQESRLTRAMKAYHLEKARDPSDLPPWLFDEKERRKPVAESSSSSRSRRPGRGDSYDDDYEERRPATRNDTPTPSRGLRDIYEAAAASSTASTPSSRSNRGARSYADDSPQPSKATDRLKALRDAKRSAVNPAVVRDEEQTRSSAQREREREPVAEAPRRRIGLPSGPVSRR